MMDVSPDSPVHSCLIIATGPSSFALLQRHVKEIAPHSLRAAFATDEHTSDGIGPMQVVGAHQPHIRGDERDED
jgi:hypothetical protein